MAEIRVHGEEADLEESTLVEGFPGIGLVGKIATDHLIEAFEMDHYASVHCDGLPRIGVYREGDPTVRPPVRLYRDAERDLLALQSDAPIASQAVGSVADCLSGWLDEAGVTPIYLSGFPAEKDGVPALYGIATGDGRDVLDSAGIDTPREDGAVSGPTGALLNLAAQHDRTSVGLVVETNPQFPDPEAARVLIESGIGPIADIDVDVNALVERAEEIRNQRERLAQRMQEAGDEESSQARPLRMYQ
ncbi:proteasome assembly chaperone family protein [Saliphagus infecundisoli]|uniref:Proteasome assembly chaperone family protein n=1 Tax=Saliphagus infecundisoli TaxID=1849069 RepID=A0ABD5QHE0_9EURY|nr:PAC2 family protein [Saliphagus infecundisoli]